MRLVHLEKTLENDIRIFESKDRPTKVSQLKNKLERVINNRLENDTKTNGLYLGQTK